MVESCKDRIPRDGYKQQCVAVFLMFVFGFPLIEKHFSYGLSLEFYLHNSEGLRNTQYHWVSVYIIYQYKYYSFILFSKFEIVVMARKQVLKISNTLCTWFKVSDEI